MSGHFLKEIEKLKQQILALSAVVEVSLRTAVRSIEEQDADLAHRVIDGDVEIDHREVDVEEECLKILALHQPVATDLRFVIAVLKINNDLERIGDLAVNIAERAVFLSAMPPPEVPLDFTRMMERVQDMVKKSLDSLVRLDAALARRVCADDDEVDAMNREMYESIKEGIRCNPTRGNINVMIHLLSVSRHLERIADHATNIAEDLIYMIEGEIVRHRTEDYKSHEQTASGIS
jgi:phosphate transport system protein